MIAISAEGNVWAWGVPGDQAQAHINSCASSLLTTGSIGHNSNVVIAKPSKILSLIRKKRIQELVCGRKHYVLLIAGTYSSYCYIKDLENVMEKNVINDNTYSKLYSHASGKKYEDIGDKGDDNDEILPSDLIDEILISRTAGNTLKFIIQAVDLNGNECESGGDCFCAMVEHEYLDYEERFHRQIASIKSPIQKLILKNDTFDMNKTTHIKSNFSKSMVLPTTFEIDDNFDGTYSAEIKLYVAGRYRLIIS